jgi:imidazoleglycerol-phosphate dehydratase
MITDTDTSLVRRGEIVIEEASRERVKAVRETLESRAWVVVECGPPDRTAIVTTRLKFLNHLIDHIAYRGLFNIAGGIEEIPLEGIPAGAPSRLLDHVICEDLGAALGGALGQLFVEQSEAYGINGCGFSTMTIDEALARVVVSVEGRPGFFFTHPAGSMPERVEDMLCCDLLNFLEGLARGMECTLHVDVLKGRDPHHLWESVFRALGEALRQVFGRCERRKGLIPGLKGTKR